MQWLLPRVPSWSPWVPYSLDAKNKQSLQGTSLPWPRDFDDGSTATPVGKVPLIDTCPYDLGPLSSPPTVKTSSSNHKTEISIYPKLMTLLRKEIIRDEQIIAHEFFTLAACITVIPIFSDGGFSDFGQSKPNEYLNSRSLSDTHHMLVEMLITRSCGPLRKLCVSDAQTKRIFSFIAENASSLQALRLPRFSISNSIVGQIVGRLSMISCLDVSYYIKFGAYALEVIDKHCKLLEGLSRNMHSLDNGGKPLQDSLVFDFAYQGLYSNSFSPTKIVYSNSGYKDRLIWAAAWLHRATNLRRHFDYLGAFAIASTMPIYLNAPSYFAFVVTWRLIVTWVVLHNLWDLNIWLAGISFKSFCKQIVANALLLCYIENRFFNYCSISYYGFEGKVMHPSYIMLMTTLLDLALVRRLSVDHQIGEIAVWILTCLFSSKLAMLFIASKSVVWVSDVQRSKSACTASSISGSVVQVWDSFYLLPTPTLELYAGVAGGSNAVGLFHEVLATKVGKLIGMEAAGLDLESAQHATHLNLYMIYLQIGKPWSGIAHPLVLYGAYIQKHTTLSHTKGASQFKPWDPGGCPIDHWHVQIAFATTRGYATVFVEVFAIFNLEDKVVLEERSNDTLLSEKSGLVAVNGPEPSTKPKELSNPKDGWIW